MNARVIEMSSIKIYPNKDYNRDTEEILSANFNEKATVIIKCAGTETVLENCSIDIYSPVKKKFGFVDLDKIKAKRGETVIYDVERSE